MLTAQLWAKLCYKGMLKSLRRCVGDTRCDLQAAHLSTSNQRWTHTDPFFFMLSFSGLGFVWGQGSCSSSVFGWLPKQLPSLLSPGPEETPDHQG